MSSGGSSPAIAVPTAAVRRARAGRGWAIWDFARRQPLGAAGGLILAIFVVVALLAHVVSPYDPLAQSLKDARTAPSLRYLLGTDEVGRDIASRIIWGSRLSLSVGIISIGLGTAIGTMWGLISGYFGGWLESIMQRIVDILLSLPMLVFAIALMAVLGASATNVIVAITLVMMPRTARIVHGSTLSTRENQYVEAARVLGCGRMRIMLRHILPNIFAPIIVVATTQLGTAIVMEASLSFLGVGVPPPSPSWGRMLSGASQVYMTQSPWMAVFPGIAISLAVLGFNLFGDALRDTLDPRLRQR